MFFCVACCSYWRFQRSWRKVCKWSEAEISGYAWALWDLAKCNALGFFKIHTGLMLVNYKTKKLAQGRKKTERSKTKYSFFSQRQFNDHLMWNIFVDFNSYLSGQLCTSVLPDEHVVVVSLCEEETLLSAAAARRISELQIWRECDLLMSLTLYSKKVGTLVTLITIQAFLF